MEAAAQTGLTIIGGGPAGLMAAETAASAGIAVDVYDAMPSVGRKLLLAGKGGLNLTHAEPLNLFLTRFGGQGETLERALNDLDASQIRAWAAGLGVETFVGSSQRVFPLEMKAAPLLRAWLRRLRAMGVRFHVRHRWQGWSADGSLLMNSPRGPMNLRPEALLLALGGASWPQLGSDGAWTALLEQRAVQVNSLRPANCGFDVAWTDYMSSRFAGAPVKTVAAGLSDTPNRGTLVRGEFVITRTGIEGGLVYAQSAQLRDRLEETGDAVWWLDLLPDRTLPELEQRLQTPRERLSLSSYLKRTTGLSAVKIGLLREFCDPKELHHPVLLARRIKHLPVRLTAARPIAEAISSAGGVAFDALDENLMLRQLPGTFCAGEMLDWEAPTGGYLLSACFATGRAAGLGVTRWLKQCEENRDREIPG